MDVFVLFASGNIQGQGLEGLQEGRGISDPQRNAVAFL